MSELPAKLFVSSSSPHLRDTDSITKIMWTVNIALLPSLLMAVYFFGTKALWLTLLSVLAAVAAEATIQKLAKRPIRVQDGSAVITGILLAFNLPASAPWWMPIIGSLFAIIIVKELFGGLGNNILNPALAARAFLLASWPIEMTASWVAPRGGTVSGISAITSATPLNLLKQSAKIIAHPEQYDPSQLQSAQEAIASLSSSYSNLLIGNIGGVSRGNIGHRFADRRIDHVLSTRNHLAYSFQLHRHRRCFQLDFRWIRGSVHWKLDLSHPFRWADFGCLLYGHRYGLFSYQL